VNPLKISYTQILYMINPSYRGVTYIQYVHTYISSWALMALMMPIYIYSLIITQEERHLNREI